MASREQRFRELGIRWWHRIGWPDLVVVVVSAVAVASTVARWTGGRLDVTVLAVASVVAMAHAYTLTLRLRFAEAEELVPRTTEYAERMARTREVLPAEPPPGWSRPVRPQRSLAWHVRTEAELVSVTVVRRGGVPVARVLIAPREGDALVGDARCEAILGKMRLVGEFAEAEPYAKFPTARAWLGALPEFELPAPVPAKPPAVREPELSPHLVAARKYLPAKLPAGWSVPVAITSSYGTEWSSGAWAVGVDDQLVLAALVTSKGRVKLMVAIISADGSRASEGEALRVLRHFRGVLEFVESPGAEDAPGSVFYLGELPASPT